MICLIQALIYLAASMTAITLAGHKEAMTAALLLYVSSLILIRGYSFFRRGRVIFKILNIFLIIALVFAVALSFKAQPDENISPELFRFWLIDIIAVIHYLIKVIGFAFRNIRFDILFRVASRSMAIEILSGLVILVFAFSLLFTSVEPGMTDFLDALWYCFALVTTIGFGDITAVTITGRILSFILGAYGIIVVALITSIIVNFYTELKNEDAAPRPKKDSPADPAPDDRSGQEEQNNN